MSDFQSSDIRIGDSEREDALGKLGEHMSAGRLDIDEFGERSAQVTAAKTRGELLELFGDLPEPRPAFGRPAPTADSVAARSAPAPSVAARVAPVLVPVVAVVVLFALTIVLKWPFIFLLPFIFIAASNSRRRGHDPRWREAHRRAMREHRDALREHHRQLRHQWRDKPY